jgi:predicted branched-subunit amino acid permease
LNPTKRAALGAAFPHTIPVMTGYLFLGTAYGIFMKTSGFPWFFPILSMRMRSLHAVLISIAR